MKEWFPTDIIAPVDINNVNKELMERLQWLAIVLCVIIPLASFCGCSGLAEPAPGSPVWYSISYEMDGGVNNPGNPMEYTASDLPIIMKSPTKAGYAFQGWTSEELGIEEPSEVVIVHLGTVGDITLAAVWGDERQDPPEDPLASGDGSQTVYDFTELGEDDFPRGEWTANKLIGKYGAPNELRTHYINEYSVVEVILKFESIEIWSLFADPVSFSFYNETAETGNYSMDEKDKEVSFEVCGLAIHDPDARLPRNIKIGQSTKAQIIGSYPEKDPYTLRSNEYGYDLIAYDYAFFDAKGNILENNGVGDISYFFDDNEVLAYIEVNWFQTGN